MTIDAADNNYCVDVIGFNPTERLLLSSIFGLAARRDPSFLQREENSPQPVDLYLVDGDDATAMNEFQAVRSRFPAPAVLVGASDRGTGLPVSARPIQWARLLQSFDDALQNGTPQAPAVNENEKTLVLRRTITRPPAATVTSEMQPNIGSAKNCVR